MGAAPVKRALVTGDRGFVGRHVRAALEAAGWSVSGLDVKRGRRPIEDVRDVFREDNYHYDLVVHCAAVVGGRELIEGNPLALAVNLEIDAAMFSWALRTKPGRVVYFSSSAVYPIDLQGKGRAYRLAEGMVSQVIIGVPDQLYGWAKLTGEILADHARRAGIPVTVLRPFSGYGADQDLAYPFPSFIDRAARRANPFDIWGDGSQVRDWIHISDIIGATMTCIDRGIDGPLNLGWGRPTSFLELADLVTTAAGTRNSTVFKIHPEKPSGVAWRVCDPTEMLKVYTPTITLEEGIVRALAARKVSV